MTWTTQERPVVANNTPLVAFWSISRLETLHQLFGEIWIPPAVRAEFLAVEQTIRIGALLSHDWIRTMELSKPELVEVFVGLDRGEAEVLALAQEANARLALIDVRKARRFAGRIGIRLSGTLGVLLLAKQTGVIEEIAPLLKSLQEAGLHLHEALISHTLQLAGE